MPLAPLPIQLVDDEPISMYKKYIDTERTWKKNPYDYKWRYMAITEIINMLLDLYGLSGARWKAVINNRLTRCLGRCHYGRKRIEIGRPYLKYKLTDFKQVLNTIKHEIAHALMPGYGHSRMWKEMARLIGSDGETYSCYTEWRQCNLIYILNLKGH